MSVGRWQSVGTRAEHVFPSPPCDGVGTLLQGPDENRARLRRFYGAKHPVPTLIILLSDFGEGGRREKTVHTRWPLGCFVEFCVVGPGLFPGRPVPLFYRPDDVPYHSRTWVPCTQLGSAVGCCPVEIPTEQCSVNCF